MLKGSLLSGAEVPVTPISMCTFTALTYSARSDSSGFPGLMALGGSTHDKEVLPVGQDWFPMIYHIDELF